MINVKFRKFHRKVSLIIFLPLLISALSGIAYRIGRSWFGLSDDFGEFFLNIHQGSYLGKDLRAFYILLLGLGLLAMLGTGLQMTGIFRKRPSST